MIKSETVKIKRIDNFDNVYIESELAKQYKSIIRWAITDVNENINLIVSYYTNEIL